LPAAFERVVARVTRKRRAPLSYEMAAAVQVEIAERPTQLRDFGAMKGCDDPKGSEVDYGEDLLPSPAA